MRVPSGVQRGAHCLSYTIHGLQRDLRNYILYIQYTPCEIIVLPDQILCE